MRAPYSPKYTTAKVAVILFFSLNSVPACSAGDYFTDGNSLAQNQESITVSHQAADELSDTNIVGTNSNSSNTSITASPKASPAKKLSSIATAFVVGTPVCMVRRTKYEETYTVNNWIGKSKSKFTRLLAGTVWLPAAIVCGCGEAPFDAFANAVRYPAFSKNQLSEGKLTQNN